MPDFLPQEIFRRIVDQLDVGVYIVDRARKIQYWNHGAERLTGFLAQDVVGRFCRDNILVHCDDHNPNLCGDDCPLTEAMRDGAAHVGQIYLRHHAGHRIPVEIHVIPLRGEDGTITGAAEIFAEHVSVPEFTSQDLVFSACGCLDQETGVPNHGLTESYLREQLGLLESHHIPFAIFVVRADSLHDFQALHGREAGVAILSAVARTLRHSLRATDFLGRWGEDRFLVMLPYSGRTPLEPAIKRLRTVVSCTAIPWWGDLQKREYQYAHDHIKCVLVFGDLRHVPRHWPDQPVTQQDARNVPTGDLSDYGGGDRTTGSSRPCAAQSSGIGKDLQKWRSKRRRSRRELANNAMADTPAPIIIKKKKGGHGGHHGGAWKVAYADFVTAMMALFIVLWLLNSSKQVQEAVGGYFKDPTGTSKKVGSNMVGSGEAFQLSKEDMPKLKEQLQKSIRQVDTFEKLKNQIEMTVTSEGLRIELLESEAGTFFDSGNATPSPNGKDLLKTLAEQLGQLPNKISIEGHTDAKPFGGKGNYSNWELSADRANAARRIMQESGVKADQVSQVRGYADQRLRKPDAPEDASNRRITLIVQYLVKSEEEDEKAEGGGKDLAGAGAKNAEASKDERTSEKVAPVEKEAAATHK